MGSTDEKAGRNNKILTLEDAAVRIRLLESLVEMLVEGLHNHQHERTVHSDTDLFCEFSGPAVHLPKELGKHT